MMEIHFVRWDDEAAAAAMPNEHPNKLKCPACAGTRFVRTNATTHTSTYECAYGQCRLRLTFGNSQMNTFDKTNNRYWDY